MLAKQWKWSEIRDQSRVRSALSNQNPKTFQEPFLISQGLKISEVGSAIFSWIHICPLCKTHVKLEKSDMLHGNCTRQTTPHNLEVWKRGSKLTTGVALGKFVNDVAIRMSCLLKLSWLEIWKMHFWVIFFFLKFKDFKDKWKLLPLSLNETLISLFPFSLLYRLLMLTTCKSQSSQEPLV